MNSVEQIPADDSRKSASRVLHALASVGLKTVAAALDCDESTISRLKTTEQKINIESFCLMLETLGLKVVSADDLTVDRERYQALLTLAEMGFAALKDGEK